MDEGPGRLHARQLDALPGRAALLDRVHALSNADLQRGNFVRRGTRLFYTVVEPGAALPKFYYRDGVQGAEHLLVDPGAMGKGTPTHYALDFATPSWDGKRIAYGISAGGSEKSVTHVMDVETGKVLAESIDRTSGSVVAWRADNQSFFYLRYVKPTPGMPANETMYNARSYLHVVGQRTDGEGDALVFGRGVNAKLDVPEGQGTWIVTSPDSKYALAIANHNMDDNPSTVYVAPLAQVKGADTPWRKIADAADGVTGFRLHGDTLYLTSQKGAPHFRLLSLPLANPVLAKATVVLPEGPGVLTDVEIAQDGLYTRTRDGAVSHVHRVSFDGKQTTPVPQAVRGQRQPARGRRAHARRAVQHARLAAVHAHVRVRPGHGPLRRHRAEPEVVDRHVGVRVGRGAGHRRRRHAASRCPSSTARTWSPTAATPPSSAATAAYGLSLEPNFNAGQPGLAGARRRDGGRAPARRRRVRRGVAHGRLHAARRSTPILDFIACGQYLDRPSLHELPARLAGQGGSAGGITVGGTLDVAGPTCSA